MNVLDTSQLAYRRFEQLNGFGGRKRAGKDMAIDPTVTVSIQRFYQTWRETDPPFRSVPNHHLGDWRYVLFVCDLLRDEP